MNYKITEEVFNSVIGKHLAGISNNEISEQEKIYAPTVQVLINAYRIKMRTMLAEDFVEEMKLMNIKICSHFGCGKHLTLQESLFGDRCINHQNRIKLDATKVLNF